MTIAKIISIKTMFGNIFKFESDPPPTLFFVNHFTNILKYEYRIWTLVVGLLEMQNWRWTMGVGQWEIDKICRATLRTDL